MSFQQGLSGLNAAAKNLDVIGNNVANSSTVGFKASQAQFADVYAASLAGATGLAAGIGTKVATIATQFTQGNISVTNNPLDIAINGKGFFRVDQQGTIFYTRNGQFQLNKDGYIVTAAGENLTGYAANANGQILPGALVNLQLSQADIAPSPTAKANVLVNLDSRQTTPTAAFNYLDPITYNSSTSMTVYDSLGNAQTYTFYFRKTAGNTWAVYSSLTNPSGTTTLQNGGSPITTLGYNTSGVLTSGAVVTANVPAIDLGTGAAALSFQLDFTGSTQFGSPFSVNAITQDGYTSGRLTGFAIDDNGIIQARYSNGQNKAQGQIVLANFTNPQGLQPLGNTLFAETATSGQPLVGAPGSGALGVLQSSATEDSTVDLTAELVNMITAQRVYQANAQTIKTQDAVLQTLVNLR
ncbi:flagellar hook protein FlgE [Thiobacter aerophilum]|uniref:Flagellar hook protein FlgE n=1 Tax=Thiobacter aerophilum TaxID=3121275 RepID=A0ABV0EFY7_9BURK